MARIPVPLRFTPSAFDSFYGGVSIILVAEPLLQSVSMLMPDMNAVLVVNENGHVRHASDEETADAFLSVSGACLGLQLCILPSDYKGVKASLLALWRQEDSKHWPKFLEAGPENTDSLAASLIDVAFTKSDLQLSRFAEQEKMIASLRRDNERLRLDLRRAVGLSRAKEGATYIATTLAKGDDTVDGQQLSRLTQRLPVTGMGLSAVRLYVVQVGAKGQVDISLSRAGGAGELQVFHLPVSSIRSGWLTLALDEVVTKGEEVELTVSWVDNCDTAFALSNSRADRFGFNQSGDSLALQVVKSVEAQPSAMPNARLVELSEEQTIPLSGFRPIGDASYQAELEQALNASPYQISETGEELHSHIILPNGNGDIRPSGFVTEFDAKGDTCNICVDLSVPNEQSEGAKVALIATKVMNFADQLALTRDLFANQNNAVSDNNSVWCVTEVSGGDSVKLSLDVSSLKASGALQLMLVSCPKTKNIAYGNVNWLHAQAIVSKAAETSAMLSPVNIWDLSRDLKFIDGNERRQELFESLGFPPLLIQGDRGFVQIHPLTDDLSAAVVDNGVPQDVIGARVSVTSAHKHAADFVFVLAAIDTNVGDWREKFKSVCGKLVDAPKVGHEVGDTENGAISYCAQRLSGGQKSYLSLPLEAKSSTRALALATVSVDGTARFGWCRFHDLSLVYPSDFSEAN